MTLPKESAEKLRDGLISQSLLANKAAEEVIKSLVMEKQVNWNLVISKQFESEQGGSDEAQP